MVDASAGFHDAKEGPSDVTTSNNDRSQSAVIEDPAAHGTASERLGALCEGLTAGISFTVSAQDMETFKRLSGDDNPIHSGVAFAQACGFEGPIVYGALMIAAISRLLGTKLPGHGCIWHSLKIDFRAPLYVDEAASLTGRVTYYNNELQLLRVTLRISSGDRIVATGEAQANTRHAAP
jgi:3-hydroxybutyryl-CoA dehydratase